MDEKAIFDFWGITFAGNGDPRLITGSPNRSEKRFLFHDDAGNSYIAEGCRTGKAHFRIRQNELLEFFRSGQLAGIHPFLRTLDGTHGVESEGLFWQIRPYIAAEPIQRATLAQREDYGTLWGEFLLQLRELSSRPAAPALPNMPFYMSDFMPSLLRLSDQKMPETTPQIREFERRLAGFFRWERQIVQMFAHGDFHPGNILISGGEIKAVIDWEFTGLKFPGYDMALLIGCLGMDHPDNLSSPAVIALQDLLCRNNYLAADAWEHLNEMIAATRMGWLGEWLSLDEKNLVQQELELLSILLDP